METLRESNPYDPPASSLARTPAHSAELASRWQRLFGRLIDSLLAEALQIPLFLTLGLEGFLKLARDPDRMRELYVGSPAGLVWTMGGFALGALNWYLVATRGQTLGKIVAGTRIVRLDGTPVGFIDGVLLRYGLFGLP